MRADIHGGQEHKRSVQGPDTEAQDLSPPNHHFPLATRGRSIQKCQKLTWIRGARVYDVGASPAAWQSATSLGLAHPQVAAAGYFARRKTTVVAGPPPDGLGTVKVNSSSPLNDSNRFCIVPSKFGKVLPFIVIVISCVDSSTT